MQLNDRISLTRRYCLIGLSSNAHTPTREPLKNDLIQPPRHSSSGRYQDQERCPSRRSASALGRSELSGTFSVRIVTPTANPLLGSATKSSASKFHAARSSLSPKTSYAADPHSSRKSYSRSANLSRKTVNARSARNRSSTVYKSLLTALLIVVTTFIIDALRSGRQRSRQLVNQSTVLSVVTAGRMTPTSSQYISFPPSTLMPSQSLLSGFTMIISRLKTGRMKMADSLLTHMNLLRHTF